MATAALQRVLSGTALAMLCMAMTPATGWAQDAPDPGPDPEPSARWNDPATQEAERMPLAAQSLLLDIANGAQGYVTVGERGHILHSTNGIDWTQAEGVPTRATLTAVTRVGDRAWAVGHDGVVLSAQGGVDHWELQRVAPWEVGVFDPDIGVPLLDVLFLDESHGFAIGAFSLMLESHDGGASWQTRFLSEETAGDADAPSVVEADDGDDWLADDDDGDDWGFSDDDLMLDAEADPHLNAIARTGSGALMIAGERGTLFRSRDDGASWERLALPYEGSMFGVLAWDDDHVMVFGLRGNVFESRDLGDNWARVESGTEASLMGGLALPDGGAILVGNEGRLLVRDGADAPFRRLTHTTAEGETPVLSAAAIGADGQVILVGERGADATRALD